MRYYVPLIGGLILAVFLGVRKIMEKKTSEMGFDLIRNFEGFSAVPYKDAHGYSIGYGHFIKPTEKFTRPITKTEADILLSNDVKSAESAINSSVKVPLSQIQFDALVSLVYNIGSGAFKNSTLLKHINAGNFNLAKNEFKRWDKSQGKVLAALTARRKIEADLFGRLA